MLHYFCYISGILTHIQQDVIRTFRDILQFRIPFLLPELVNILCDGLHTGGVQRGYPVLLQDQHRTYYLTSQQFQGYKNRVKYETSRTNRSCYN